jgi:hypothetical protein
MEALPFMEYIGQKNFDLDKYSPRSGDHIGDHRLGTHSSTVPRYILVRENMPVRGLGVDRSNYPTRATGNESGPLRSGLGTEAHMNRPLGNVFFTFILSLL